jgi:hypothetical protein
LEKIFNGEWGVRREPKIFLARVLDVFSPKKRKMKKILAALIAGFY